MTPGPSTSNVLAPETHLGSVHLTVADLDRSVAFYERSLGFRLHRRQGATAGLGAGGRDLLVLTEEPGARPARRSTGLYHFAILVPSRYALAQALLRLIDTGTEISGASDHAVSEALYLSDPDENGIEIYRDRPRGEWRYSHGQVFMTTERLDLEGVLGELKGENERWPHLDPATVLGHVHLHVADLAETERFYRDAVGFDLMLRFHGTALFLSAGGYHHHLGANVWRGVGAPPPPPGSTGLRHFEVLLPNVEERERLKRRLDDSGVAYEDGAAGLLVRDPSGNGLVFRVEG